MSKLKSFKHIIIFLGGKSDTHEDGGRMKCFQIIFKKKSRKKKNKPDFCF